MSSNENRALHYAVFFSIALHAALLFGVSMQRDAARRAAPLGPIIARLVQPPAPAPAAPQPQPAKPQPKPEARPAPPPPPAAKKAPPPKRAPVVKPAPKAEARAGPAPVAPPPRVEPPPAPSAAPAAPSAVPPLAVPATPTVPSAPPIAKSEPTPAPAAPAVEAVDAGSLAQYRLQLISAARKYKRYPRVAMDNNWEGEVVVRMVIGANGMIAALSIKTSSGHDVLDRQALEMFKRAKPLVLVPAALRGKEFVVELRAIYNLKDQESG